MAKFNPVNGRRIRLGASLHEFSLFELESVYIWVRSFSRHSSKCIHRRPRLSNGHIDYTCTLY